MSGTLEMVDMSDKKVFVVMMTRNEDDIIGYNLEYLQTQHIDHFYIANNLSTDNTSTILSDLSRKYNNITVISDDEETYLQDQKMNKFIDTCYDMGADYILPIDSDEKWYSKIYGKTLGQAVKQFDEPTVFGVELIDFLPDEDQVIVGSPFDEIKNVRCWYPSIPKVGYTSQRRSVLAMGNHNVFGHTGPIIRTVIGAYQYQYRSWDHFLKKVRNNMTSIKEHPNRFMGTHWRRLIEMNDEELREEWISIVRSDKYKVY